MSTRPVRSALNTAAVRCALCAIALLLALPLSLSAQEATLTGTVTDSATAQPLATAQLVLTSAAGTRVWTGQSDDAGRFRATGLEAGTYNLSASLIGYARTDITIDLAAGETQTIAVSMIGRAINLDPLVVTVNRTEQTLLETPVSISVVEPRVLEEQTALTTIEYLAVLPGAEVLSGGLMTRRYTTRGPNFGNSATVRAMSGFRYTTLPAIAANVDYAVSTTVEDVERIELIRGQGSVQYGPNASRGVLNLVTRSPLDHRGTVVNVAAGSRATAQGTIRHSSAISDKVGFKISGEYFQGEDWLPPNVAADSVIGFNNLNDSQRIRADAEIEWRPDPETTAKFSGGLAQASVLDAVSFGGNAVYLDDARTWFLQGRMARGQFKANLFFNKNDIEDAVFPALGIPLIEKSYELWAQLQHGAQIGSRESLIYGIDFGRTVANSDSTLYGGFEDEADGTLLGAFVSSTTNLTSRIDLLLSGRVDYNNLYDNLAFSPWATVIFRPEPSHAIRFSASRSFYSTSPIGAYQDFAVAPVGPLPYSVRSFGSPTGRTFRRDCDGLCMRSPFNPSSAGGASEYLSADATTQWAAAVALLQAQGIDISGIPAPNASQVGSVLASLNLGTGGFDPSSASDVIDTGGAERRWINQLEVGYKAVIEDRVRVGVDVYYRENNQIASQQEIVTPNVFFDPASLESYLAQFVPAEQAAALASALAGIPMGTITPQEANNPTDIALGQFRVRGISYWGAALDVAVGITPELSAFAGYTWISEDSIASPQSVVIFNNPKNRVSFGLDYVNGRAGFNAGFQGRILQSYPGANGSFRARIPSYTLIDVVGGYRIPRTNITLTLTAYNIFDDVHQELPGAAAIGRQVLFGIRTIF